MLCLLSLTGMLCLLGIARGWLIACGGCLVCCWGLHEALGLCWGLLGMLWVLLMLL